MFVELHHPEEIDTQVDAATVKLCAELGLSAQVRIHTSDTKLMRAFEKCRLSQDERMVWETYCPTSYSSVDWGLRKLSDYRFDTIPFSVLEHWKKCVALGFESVQIRTTEKTLYRDPILLGWLFEEAFLLARWGEEAPGEVTFDDICKRLAENARSMFFKRLRENGPQWLRTESRVEKARALCEENCRQQATDSPTSSSWRIHVALDNLGYSVFT